MDIRAVEVCSGDRSAGKADLNMRKAPSIAKVGFLILLLFISCGSAFADLAFSVQGSSTGQFFLGSSIPLGTSSLFGLTFTGSKFGPTANPTINLGTFDLGAFISYFDPFNFDLTVNFVAPAVGGTVFTADLSGLVIFQRGSVAVDFVDNGPRHFQFSSPQGSGSFDLYITDVTVANGNSASIMGTITNATFAATPEPAAVALTSALLGGLLLVFRKRLKAS